jgi:hypothetical protein
VGNDPTDKADPTGEDCVDPKTGPCETVTVTATKSPPPSNRATTIPLVLPAAIPRAPVRLGFAAIAARILAGMLLEGCGDSGTVGACAKGSNTMSSEEGNQQSDADRNPADDQKLTPGEIDKLKGAGHDPEEIKGGKATGKLDLYKDKRGNIYIEPKGGGGPGEPTGININKP